MQVNTNIPRILSVIVIMAFGHLALAQDNIIQDYILYKQYPYVVSMTTDGEILEFIRTAPELMNSSFDKNAEPPMALGPYTRPQVDIAEYISPLNTTAVGDLVTKDSEIKKDSDINVAPGEAVTRNEPPSVGGNPATNSTPMTTTIIRKEREDVGAPPVYNRTNTPVIVNENVYDLKFQGFTARLTPVLINQIKKISNMHKQSPDKFVEIRSFLTAGDETNKKLALNRMRACKDLLETYGVPSDKIDTGIRPYSNANAGQVSIEFVDKSDGE